MDLPPQDLAIYEIVIRVDGNVDRCRYNAPTSNKVAGLMPSEWRRGIEFASQLPPNIFVNINLKKNHCFIYVPFRTYKIKSGIVC
jgi:hypothetical protein